MTSASARNLRLPLAAALLALLAGCIQEVDAFPEPSDMQEAVAVARTAASGVVVATFASFPLKEGKPPDGMRAAMLQAIGRRPCSAATFYWDKGPVAIRWIREQLQVRRNAGLPQRLILAGHGLGATEAAEMAREVLFEEPGVEIVLLLTVDAVKTGRINTAAGVTGAATVGRIPGVNVKFTAYDSAPPPDGVRLWAHINYYQAASSLYAGAPMTAAENHRLDDWTGLLNHGNSDDFAFPLLVADLRRAVERGSR